MFTTVSRPQLVRIPPAWPAAAADEADGQVRAVAVEVDRLERTLLDSSRALSQAGDVLDPSTPR
jgi:hypothetical protein